MAIASNRTILSLDRYAKIMGINPLFFNGGNQIELSNGKTLFPLDNAQNDIWPQYSWQNVDQVSREDLAYLIRVSEMDIINYLGYSPVPIWTIEERHQLGTHYKPEYQGTMMPYNVMGYGTEVRTNLSKVISGGRRAVTLIDTPSIVYTDTDGDGWDEDAVITVAVSSSIDTKEVKAYFSGHGGDMRYEIREPKSKVYSGGNLVFVFNSWQMVDPELLETLPTDDTDGKMISMQDTSNFVTDVDIYREYNDTTQNHCLFHFEAITGDTQSGGMFYKIDSANFVTPVMATYNSTDGVWERSYTQCPYPDYVDLWYYSGMRTQSFAAIKSDDDYLPQDIAKAIAYMATARLERVFYANNNATSLAARLRVDLAESEQGKYRAVPPDATTNPFGSRVGEYEAWRAISKLGRGRITGGSL